MKRAEVVEPGTDGRAEQVQVRQLDAGVIKDDYMLAYDWAATTQVSLAAWSQSQALKAQDGAYSLAEDGDGTRGDLPARGRPQDPDARACSSARPRR